MLTKANASADMGKRIAALRKEKGATQEELARCVGVSAQAVSKWECGGLPDTELLPAIADFFGVAVDTLFGRRAADYGGLKEEMAKHIAGEPENRRFQTAIDYCWAIEMTLSGEAQIKDFPWEDAWTQEPDVYSQILFPSGMSLFSLSAALPYFLLMPEPEGGWKSGLLPKEDYAAFFALLGEPKVLDVLFLLYGRDGRPFTRGFLERELSLAEEDAERVARRLCGHGLLQESEIEGDDGVQKFYRFRPNPAFVALLAAARAMIRGPHLFQVYYDNRGGKPYL